MELMNRDKFIESLRHGIPEELPWFEDDRFGTFPVMNHGIQIWLLLCPHVGSDSIFKALLPCRSDPSGPPVAINLALWESDYYRFPTTIPYERGHLQLHQVFLRYQDMLHCNTRFEIDDSAIHDNQKGFTSATYPEEIITGNTVTLGTTDPLCVKSYSCRWQGYHFAVGFGRCFDQNWIHVIGREPYSPLGSWSCYGPMLDRVPEHAQSMKKTRSGAARHQLYILQTHLPGSTWILKTSCVMWKSSRMYYGVKLEVFQDHGVGNVSGEWTGFNVDVSRFFFVHTYHHLIGVDIANREQTIPTATGRVS